MAILGVGCDILYLPRIKQMLQKETKKFNRLTLISNKIMHPVELQHYHRLLETHDEGKIIEYFGSIWSIKESIYKSLSFKEQKSLPFFKMCRTYYKINDPKQNNRPLLIKQDGDKGTLHHLSLSQDTNYIASYLVREARDLHG